MAADDTAPLDIANTSRTITVDGIRLHYHVVECPKASSIPIVFTHGGGPGSSGWNNFLYNARAFSQRYTCYFLDLPGFGGSECIPVSGPVHTWYAERFLKFLDALKLERVHMVNQSFGGAMAIKVAAMAPKYIDHIVISGSRPIVGGVLAPVAMQRSREAMKNYYDNPSIDKMRSLIADLEFLQPSKITDLNVQSRYELSIKPDILAFMSNAENRGRPESLAEDFRNVKSRTLIVHGLHDVFGSIDVPLYMLNQFADARLHIVANAAHHVQTECATEYNAVVLGFLPYSV